MIKPSDFSKMEEQSPRELFVERSKQSWTDVTLQIYKCFVLSRINAKAMRENGAYARVEELTQQEDIEIKESNSVETNKTRFK